MSTSDPSSAVGGGTNKPKRASTSTKNRPRSPSPYRAHPDQSATEFLTSFWQHTIDIAESVDDDFKHQALPLARIKKVMKSDPEVKMISSEVTVLLEKACQIFIQEITNRAHMVSLSSRRRTLARDDVAEAIGKSDMFDFLIDIVPRDENEPEASKATDGDTIDASTSNAKASTSRTTLDDDEEGGGAVEDAGMGAPKPKMKKRPSRATGRPRGRPRKRPLEETTETSESIAEAEEAKRARRVAEEEARHAAAMEQLTAGHRSSSRPPSLTYGMPPGALPPGMPMGVIPPAQPPSLGPPPHPGMVGATNDDHQRWMMEQFQRNGAGHLSAPPFIAPGALPWPSAFGYDVSF